MYPSNLCHKSKINTGLKKSLSDLMRGAPPPFCPKSTVGAKECFKDCLG